MSTNGQPSPRDEMLLVPHIELKPFNKWDVDFVGPISPLGRRKCARYIITTIYYLIRWDKEAPMKDCTAATSVRYLFDNVVMRFGCTNILIRNQGAHFLNQTIKTITKEFQI